MIVTRPPLAFAPSVKERDSCACSRRSMFAVLITRLGLMETTPNSRMGRRLRERDTLVGSIPRSACRRGIRIQGRASGAADTIVRFADGDSLSVSPVIWATGFTVDHGWIDAPIVDAADRRPSPVGDFTAWRSRVACAAESSCCRRPPRLPPDRPRTVR